MQKQLDKVRHRGHWAQTNIGAQTKGRVSGWSLRYKKK